LDRSHTRFIGFKDHGIEVNAGVFPHDIKASFYGEGPLVVSRLLPFAFDR
jgi:hypothetical protein